MPNKKKPMSEVMTWEQVDFKELEQIADKIKKFTESEGERLYGSNGSDEAAESSEPELGTSRHKRTL